MRLVVSTHVASCAFLLLCAPALLAQTVASAPTRARAVDGSYISWKEHLVDDQQLGGGIILRGGDGLQMADLDQDGHEDIVSVHEDNHHVRVAFGSDDPDRWELVTLAERDEAGAAEDVSIADANGDGWLDIVVACELAHLIYFQNPGENIRVGDWPRVIPDGANQRGSYIRVFFADLNADGRPEVVAPNKGRQDPRIGVDVHKKEISYFELPDNPLDGNGWREHVLARVEIPINSHPVDLDGDGDIDVVGGSRGETRVFWFENLGGKPTRFDYHPIEIADRTPSAATGAWRMTGFNMGFLDLSGDGRLDIVLQKNRANVVWLAQPLDPEATWRLHVVGTTAPDAATAICLLDINGDGLDDLFTGGYSRGNRQQDDPEVGINDALGRLVWFENPGDPGRQWPRHDVSRRKRGMFDAFVARDMNADGLMDLVGTRGNSGNFDGVFWLEQVRTPQPVRAFTPARENESEHFALP
jgi:hypothetical protein